MSFSLQEYITAAEDLGRSEAFIDETVAYAKELLANDYPVIFSLEHLAILMELPSDFLRVLTGDLKEKANVHPLKNMRYTYFKLYKRRGGYRELMVPSKDLKYIQKWILVNILNHYPLHKACTGFRSGFSIRDNAQPHEQSDMVLKIDLLKFFDTITEQRIYGVFKAMGYAKNLAVSLAKLTTAQHKGSYWDSFSHSEKELLKPLITKMPSVLPQGAPSSPMLANIVASRLDRRLAGLAQKMGFRYTRYADDLTFSIGEKGKLPSIALLKEIIVEEGFYINEEKVRFLGKGSKQYVTGITTSNGVNVSKKYRKDIGSHIYYARKYGVKNHLFRINEGQGMNVLRFHDWLYGHICFICSINRKAGEKMLTDFNKIDWLL